MRAPIENIVHNNLGKILTSNTKLKKGLYALKNSDNLYAKCQTADKLSEISPFYNRFLYGNPLPSSIESVGVSKSSFYTDDILLEMDWLILSARKYKAEINIFLNYKKDFENAFLLGNYDEALNIIEKAIEHTGFSIWSISSKMLVFEYTASQDKAKLLQSEILEKNKDGTFTTSLINFLSQRSERRLSAYRYDNDLKNALSNVKSNIDKSNKDYYNFQLNFFETLEYSETKDVLLFDYCNPIVDRYLTFRRLVLYCICNNIEITQVVERVKYLQRRIPDDLFDTVGLFLNSAFENKDFFDIEYLRIMDLYYSGLYEETCEAIRKKMLVGDVNFSLTNIYSRSLVLNNKSFSPLSDSPCILNEIAEHIYKIYKRSSNPSEVLYSLYQINKNIDSFDFNYQLNTFIKAEQGATYNPNYQLLSGKKADPILADAFSDKPDLIESVFNKIIDKTFDSIAINYRIKTLKGDYESIKGIAENKLEIDKAKHLYQIKDYNEALKLWEKILNAKIVTPPVMEAAIDYVFRILSDTERYDECIKWYVESIVKNPFTVYKVNTQDVHKALKKARFKNVKINICLPIFISFISKDENEKAFAIELFCKSLGASFPSDLFNKEIKQDPLTELFLYYSCNNETLKNYSKLNTTKKRLDERINICNYLASNFDVNKESYIQELNLLTNELIIHEGTQKLDESKIYANDQAILNTELDEYEGLYNRYITISGLFLKNKKILTINKNELRFLDKKGEIEYSQNEIEYSKNADIDAFYNLFSVIREKFLFSKFGIVTYLSTRIRHGVLLGELRPELEKHNLIFFRNKLRDRYEPNSFWLSGNLNNSEKEKLISLISVFSAKIDTLINSIIKDNIQIKLNEEYPNAWFDYEFSIEELYTHSITLYYEENYKAFCKKILDILWLRTDDNLDKIRNLLQEEIKDRFIELINEFDSELHRLLGKNKMPEIFSATSTCSTNIQNKINKIASWFKRSGKTHSDFYLNTLIEIICKTLQRAHTQKFLLFSLKLNDNTYIKGEYYAHFNDFIRIFIENMFKHSTGTKTNCVIETRQINGNIEMVFENDNVNTDNEIPLENFGRGIHIDGIKLITEGKSGIMKARKTLKDDLKDSQNDLFVSIENGKFQITAIINYNPLLV